MQFEQSFLDALSGQSAIVDGDGTILFTNSDWRSYAEDNSYQPSEEDTAFGIGRNYLTICDGADGDCSEGAGLVAKGIRDVINGRIQEFRHEYPCHSPDQHRYFKCLVRPLQYAPGSGDTFLIQHVDVTEQVSRRLGAEDRLERHQQRLAELIDAIPVRIANLGEDLVYRFANPEFARGVGLPVSEIEGKTPKEVLGQEAWDELRPYVERALKGETVTFETDLRLASGENLQAIVTYIPDQDSSGRIAGLFAFIQDVTELKRRQDRLFLAMQAAEQANRAKSQFLASMSHELRTPLNAIIGFAEMIRLQIGRQHTPDKQSEYAGDVLTSARHLLSMVDDILDLSAIEGGKVSIDKQRVDLMEIFEECERAVRQLVERKGLLLAISSPRTPTVLHADERAIRQILLNILSNAIKYTPEDGKITANVLQLDGFVQIQICDNGIGIAKERLNRVTEAFSRAGHEPYIADKGWGLGLSISKALVELHDGALRIDSELDQGTTVTITLPAGVETRRPVSIAS